MPVFDAAPIQGVPAPYWLVEVIKTLGFALHLIPMGLWLVGTPVSLLLWLVGGAASKRLAQRFLQQLPIIVAFGVLFGMASLLFTQLTYPNAFFTSTILLAAHWLGAVPLFFVGYAATCFAAGCARAEKIWRTALHLCVATCCYVGVGLVFSSVWAFFERPYEWEGVWRNSTFSFGELVLGGAATASGLGRYWSDYLLFLRFAGIVGVGFFALATWFVFDAYYLYRGPRKLTSEEISRLRAAENEDDSEEGKRKKRAPRKPIQENAETYTSRTTGLAFFLMLPGFLVAAAAIGKYALESTAPLQNEEHWNPLLWNVLLGGIGASMIFPFFFVLLNKLKKISGRSLAISMIFCESMLVGFYATLRQILQNARLFPYFDPSKSCSSEFPMVPILAFLVVFLGVATTTSLVVATLSPKDKKRSAKKLKKSPKPSKNSTSDKQESKEPQKPNVSQSPNSAQRPSGAPNPQFRNLNNRQNLRR